MRKIYAFVAILILFCSFSVAMVDAAEKEKITVGVVLHAPIPFVEPIKRGAENAAKDYNVDVEIVTPPQFDPEAEIALFEGLVAKGVDALMTLPVPEMSWVVPINNAVDAGIPVFTIDITPIGSKASCFFGPTGHVSGRILGDLMVNALKAKGITKGKVIIGYCAPGIAQLEGRAAGYIEAFQGTDFEVIGPLNTAHEQQDNYAFWESAYAANPNMVAGAGMCDQDAANMGKHKMKTGADYLSTGWDESPETLAAIKDGLVLATLGEHPYLYGYLGVKAFAEHFYEGKPLPEGWIHLGGELVTQENAAEVIARESDPAKEEEWYNNYIKKDIPDLNSATKPLEELEDLKYLQ